MSTPYIIENEDGAYLDVTPEFLSVFRAVERNPNFDVFDRDGIRIMLTKCSRLVDDENLANGRYGIDFNRSLPSFTNNWPQGILSLSINPPGPYPQVNVRVRRALITISWPLLSGK